MITNEQKAMEEERKAKHLKIRHRLSFLFSLGVVLVIFGIIGRDPNSIIYIAIGGIIVLVGTLLLMMFDRKTKLTQKEILEYSRKKNPFSKKNK